MADAIRQVLAQYRSTEGHITQNMITAAWALYDRLRSVIARLNEQADVHPCADCGLPTNYAIGSYWLADDELWQQVVGRAEIVLCPGCFHDRARGIGVPIAWQARSEA